MKIAESTMQVTFAEPRYIERLADCFFYHTMTLPGFGEVPGHWDLRGRFNDYIGNVEVKGKSVIDIGCATGFLSFESERNGASEVVSFDMDHARRQRFLPFRDKLQYRDPVTWAERYNLEIERFKNAYWLCHRLLKSSAKVYYGDICNLPLGLGRFDIAIVGSVLEHLPDQISALASISRLVRETIVIVSPLIHSDESIAHFEGSVDRADNEFTWWTYSIGLYREVFKMLGFEIDRITESQYFFQYQERFESRDTLVARRNQ
jgi:SAM-dependent methyltransferase